MKKSLALRGALVAALATSLLLFSPPAAAQENIVLRIHHFMSAKSSLHKNFLVPFSERLHEASGGRLSAKIFHSMSLGGRPGDLYDQAVDGAVDIILTLPGYTSGRFNRTEVFELPFMTKDSVATSQAFWDLIAGELQEDEYRETKILSGWVHSPGVIHSKTPIHRLEDARGLEMRGPTRVITDYLGEIGALPVGMPLPKIPASLSKGVIIATLLPWEVTPSIRLAELVSHHTEFPSEDKLYTATFILAMNHDAYDSLPADLRAIIDAETGKAMSARASRVMVAADAPAREKASQNDIHQMPPAEISRWRQAAEPVYARWIARAHDKGFDGSDAINQAKTLIHNNR